MRTGIGYDAHRLEEGRPLILGGVSVPFSKGLSGHSDADVLVHAVIDALLGAAALGDIGYIFPDSDDKYKNISSITLLKETYGLLNNNYYRIINIDATIVAEKPKLSPYINEIRRNIADALNTDISDISVKAKTEEGMGFTGKSLGMAAMAVCLIEKKA